MGGVTFEGVAIGRGRIVGDRSTISVVQRTTSGRHDGYVQKTDLRECCYDFVGC